MDIAFHRNASGRYHALSVQKNAEDKRVSTESHFLYRLKQTLLHKGHDVIKKRMWKDGHMYGSEQTQYIRSRKVNTPDSIMIYDGDYAIRNLATDFNHGRVISLLVDYCLEND